MHRLAILPIAAHAFNPNPYTGLVSDHYSFSKLLRLAFLEIQRKFTSSLPLEFPCESPFRFLIWIVRSGNLRSEVCQLL
jgi:hypothetical protein